MCFLFCRTRYFEIYRMMEKIHIVGGRKTRDISALVQIQRNDLMSERACCDVLTLQTYKLVIFGEGARFVTFKELMEG